MKRDKTGASINEEAIKQMVEEMKKLGIKPTSAPKKKNPPIFIPSVWTEKELDDYDWEKQQEEANLLRFMQECRERTIDMKDEEKCERCKLRFRCYTEIKVEKKKKKSGRKLSTQPIMYKGILRGQSLPVLDGKVIDDIDWLKVVKSVSESS